ncbi:hypothetical protein KYG_07505 [Acidovorax sp. NO-1]|nr:hypothetical protein KYG_07505 [Acidovorax sp. NO-1]
MEPAEEAFLDIGLDVGFMDVGVQLFSVWGA